jgi:hypothetical protein
MRVEGAAKLAELSEAIDNLNERFRLSADGFTLPPIEVPEPEIDEGIPRQALVSLDDDWVAATQAMIAHKQYAS